MISVVVHDGACEFFLENLTIKVSDAVQAAIHNSALSEHPLFSDLSVRLLL